MAVQSRSASAGVVRRVTIALLAVLACQTPGRATDYTWIATVSGNYNVGANWTPGGGPPGAADNAFLLGTTAYTTTLNDNRSINNLTINNANAVFLQTAGTFTVGGTINLAAGTYRLDGGTISGGSITSTGGTLNLRQNNNNILNNVAVGVGVLDFTTNLGKVRLQGSTSLASGTTLSLGSGSVLGFEQTVTTGNLTVNLTSQSSLTVEGNNTLTLGAGTTVTHGSLGTASIAAELVVAGNTAILNQGLIVNTSAGAINIGADTFTNQAGGIVRMLGGAININTGGVINTATGTGGFEVVAGNFNLNGTNWINNGNIRISGGNLNLGGTFTTAGIGIANFTRTGGVVNLTGALDNTAATLALTASSGSFQLNGGIITGGSIAATGGSTLQLNNNNGNRLNNVAVGVGVLSFGGSGSGSRVRLQGTSSLAAGSVIDLSGGAMGFDQTVTLNNVTLNLTFNGASVSVEGTNTLAIGATTTISANNAGTSTNVFLGNQTFVAGSNVLLNQGLIRSTGSGILTISPTTFTNQSGGIVRATAGNLTISPGGVINAAGGIFDVNGGALNLNGTNWSNAGNTTVSSGTLNLGGTFTTAAIGLPNLTRTGGNVAVTGAMDNTATTLALTAGTGSFQLNGGTITGGSITSAAGATLQPQNNNNNRLNNVAVGVGVLDFGTSFGRVRLQGTTSLASGSVINLSSGTNILAFEQTATVNGVTINVSSSNNSVTVEPTYTLTLGPATTVIHSSTFGNNMLGNQFLVAGPATLINQGLIHNTGTGALNIVPGTLTNTGTVRASAGGIVIPATTNLTNFAGNTLTGGTWEAAGTGNLNFGTRTINTIAAGTTVTLSGPGSVFAAVNPVTAVNGTFNDRGGRTFTFAGPTLDVGATGTLTVGDTNSVLSVPDAVTFSNFAAGTLTAGTYQVLDAGTLGFGTRAITTNAATVILSGPASTFAAINGFTTNNAGGNFQVLAGRAFTLANNATNAGAVTVGAGSTLTVAGVAHSGTLTVGGAVTQTGSTFTWTGSNDIVGQTGATWNVQAAAAFDAQNNQSFAVASGNPTFTNAGTFRKSVGNATTTMAWGFANAGTVDVQAGTLAFTGGGSSTGAFTVATALQFNGGTFNFTAGSGVSGAGTTTFTAGTVNVAVPYTTATVINGGTSNFSGGPYTIPTLLFNSGTFGGNATVNVSGATTWSGGTFAASSTLIAIGGAAISGATTSQVLAGGFLSLGGSTSTWSGGNVLIDNGSILTNLVNSVFTATGDNSIIRNNFNGSATFVNAGTFRKQTGSGTTTIGSQVAFTNSGTVDVASGTLTFNGGGTSTGAFTVATALQFNGGTFDFTVGAGVSGAGTTTFAGGTVNVAVPYTTATVINGGASNFGGGPYTIPTFLFSSGALGGNATVNVSGATTWSGGTFVASGTLIANGGASITGATTNQVFNGGSMSLGGSASTWSGGNILIDNGSVLTNLANSVFTATGDNSINRNNFNGSGTFVNAGTFRKQTGTGTTTIGNQVTFTNSGTVDVQSGTLTFNGGGLSTGAFTVATALQFNGGTFDFTAGAGVSGAGTTAFTGGTVNLAVPYTTATTINGGTANFNSGPYTVPSLSLTIGSLGGNSAIGVAGATTWSGGSFSGSSTVAANGGATITGATTNQVLNGGSLSLGGSASTWSGGNILIDNGSVLTNLANSVFTATGDNSIIRNNFNGSATFVNAGTFRKQTGAGTTTIGSQVTFSNSGIVDVQSGTLAIGNVLTSTGTVTSALGTTVNGAVTSNSGGMVRGVGTYAGPLQFNSGSTLHPGSSPGILTVTGAVTMASGSTFSVELNGTTPGNSGHGQLLLSGASSINLGGANLATTLGYAPGGSDSLAIIAGGPVLGTFANAPAGVPFSVGSFGGQPYHAFVFYGSNSVVLANFAPVPEPTHLLLAGGAMGAIGWWRRRRPLRFDSSRR